MEQRYFVTQAFEKGVKTQENNIYLADNSAALRHRPGCPSETYLQLTYFGIPTLFVPQLLILTLVKGLKRIWV